MKKVLIITYYWPPSGGAGVQRWLKFARYLPRKGAEPFILTVDPDYASYPQIDESLERDIPAGLKVYRTKSREILHLVSGILGRDKVPYGGFSNVDTSGLFQTLMRFIRGNLFIPDARKGWNRYAVKTAREIISVNDIPVVITTGPPHSTHLVGLKLKKRLGVRWIADFRDPWTDIYYYKDLLHTIPAREIDRRLEREVLDMADNVIVNCNSNKELLLAKTRNREAGKFSVITNGYDPQDFKIDVEPADDFIITWSGTMSGHYNPDVFFSTLADLVRQYPRVSFKFRVAGTISSSARRQLKEYGLEGIFDYPGYVAHEKLVEYLKESSALLYIFPETEKDKGVAGKLFEYLASERPVIAIGPPDSDAAAIIEECDAGKTFPRDDEGGLLNYLSGLVERFKRGEHITAGNGNHTEYTREKLAWRLAQLI